MPDADPATADSRLSPQRALDWLRVRLVPRMEASDRVSDELAALTGELLRADRDPDRATEKLDDWVDSRKGSPAVGDASPAAQSSAANSRARSRTLAASIRTCSPSR